MYIYEFTLKLSVHNLVSFSRKNAKMTKFYEYVGKIREGMSRGGGCTLLFYASLVDFQGFRGEKIGW